MKKTNLKTFGILLIASLVSTSACKNSGTSTSSTVDSVVTKTDSVVSDVKQGAQNVANDVKNALNGNPDSTFVVKATIANLEELQILKAGLNKGTDKDLKAHAKMMIADHEKLGAKVKEYASKKGYTLPDNDNGQGDNAITTLDKNDNGKAWDKAWTDDLVNGHQDAINLFEDNQNTVKDPDLKTLIADALPTLHAHFDMMKQLQNKLEQ